MDEQTLKPNEVVLVRDGVVPPRLQSVIDDLVETSPVPINVVALADNIGLGHALDAGLSACAHEVVARMDADDVSLPERFAVQIPLLADGFDLVGSALLEFHEHEDDIVGRRTPPSARTRFDRGPASMTPSTTPRWSTAAPWCRQSVATGTCR